VLQGYTYENKIFQEKRKVSNRELVEALIGQRKRWELEINSLKEELGTADNKMKIKKKIVELDLKISRVNSQISGLQTSHRDIDY